jgi:hypothetical protein
MFGMNRLAENFDETLGINIPINLRDSIQFVAQKKKMDD